MFRPCMLLSGLVLLATAARAQDPATQLVGVTGMVQPLPGPIGCFDATHKLACTDVFLVADPGVLDPLIGKLVKLYGETSPVTPCHLVKVSAVDVMPPSTLDWCGSPAPGCELKFNICPGGISQFWLFAALSPGFHPLDPSKGTWLLGDSASLIVQGFGGGPCDSVTFIVPKLPVLIGVTFWVQGARRDIGPVGPITLTNASCLSILPSTIPCVLPNC